MPTRFGMVPFEWTAAAVAVLTQRWATGHSASRIAAELGGGLTRSAVCGKIHRLQLSKGQASPPARGKETTPAAGKRTQPVRGHLSAPVRGKLPPRQWDAGAVRVPEAPKLTLVAGAAYAPLPGFAPVRLVDHQQHQCRWPIDVEGEHASRCCGAPRDGEHVYCATHRVRSVAAVTPGRPGKVIAQELFNRARGA